MMMSSNCCRQQDVHDSGNLTAYVESILGPAFPSHNVMLTTVVVYGLILIFGVLGNVCAICSILRYSRKGCASNLYLLSLALSDFTLLVFGLPLELRDAVTAYYPYSLPSFVCPSRAFLIEMSGNVSALTITAFSIQRWLAICFPLKARSAYRFRRTLKTLLAIWIVGAAGASPVLVAVKINRLPMPRVDENGDYDSDDPGVAPLGDSDSTMLMIPNTDFCAADSTRPLLELAIIQYSFWTSFVIPLLIIIILYVHIAVTIRRTCSVHSPLLRQHRELVQRKSAVKMLVAVAAAFFVCWFPFHMQRLLSVYRGEGDMDPWIESMYSLLYFISGYFYYANAVVNPLLYTMLSTRIRKGLMSSLRQRSFSNGSTLNLNGYIEHEYTTTAIYASSIFALRRSVLSVILVATNAGKHNGKHPKVPIRQESTTSASIMAGGMRTSRVSSYPAVRKMHLKRLEACHGRMSSSPELL